MDIFDYVEKKNDNRPLATRVRPESIDEIFGQIHILGEDGLLTKMIKEDSISSIILYGPPGTGKTTIASVIANITNWEFIKINANTSGKKDLEQITSDGKTRKKFYNKKTIVFIDEIHRFNKAQQDYLLPFVEDGTIIIIGATTENPYFEVNSALLSRTTIFRLEYLSLEETIELIKYAIKSPKGYGNIKINISDKSINLIGKAAKGDGRKALCFLENVIVYSKDNDGEINVLEDDVLKVLGEGISTGDKNGDNHYDTISAFIKSMRGSDMQATAFYLGKLLDYGEDIKFIARRIMISAAEDVGLANPNALNVAVSASLAVERIGMPEARIILSEAALYVASSNKSNSAYMAIDKAIAINRNTFTTIPKKLRDTHYSGAENFNYGEGYMYPHNNEDSYIEDDYLPDEVKDLIFYERSKNDIIDNKNIK